MMKLNTWLMVLAGCAAAEAHGQSLFDWSFTPTGGSVDGSGTMIVDTSPDDYSSNGGYLVESISGTYLGEPISGLAAAGSYNGNDNQLQNLTGLPPFQLDFAGVAFYYGASGEENFRFSEVGDYANQDETPGVFSATPDLAPVPESPLNPGLLAAAGLFIGWRSWRGARVSRA